MVSIDTYCKQIKSNQIKSNQIKSNQIKSNQNKQKMNACISESSDEIATPAIRMSYKDKPTAEAEMIKLERFLENNKTHNQTEPWSKLDKTVRMRKLTAYAITYTELNGLSAEEAIILLTFLKDSLDRKKFQRVKDVEYNKLTGTVISIPSMLYTKTAKHFTLKNVDKRVSTLKGLPPKRHNSSKKVAITSQGDDDDNDDEGDVDVDLEADVEN